MGIFEILDWVCFIGAGISLVAFVVVVYLGGCEKRGMTPYGSKKKR